jgi:hypothetical protein
MGRRSVLSLASRELEQAAEVDERFAGLGKQRFDDSAPERSFYELRASFL